MGTNEYYESKDGMVTVNLHYTKEAKPKLAAITIVAGNSGIHLETSYIGEIIEILTEIAKIVPPEAE